MNARAVRAEHRGGGAGWGRSVTAAINKAGEGIDGGQTSSLREAELGSFEVDGGLGLVKWQRRHLGAKRLKRRRWRRLVHGIKAARALKVTAPVRLKRRSCERRPVWIDDGVVVRCLGSLRF
ncbi:hypothetical protein M0R45_002364 [Rubus argutus]|uniref:Uncharacterized protein n=1 Tax=Rubus argutus TaxID=59490 RepID=A0AAW1VJ79_RUBAR